MIHDASTWPPNTSLEADLCVVGSGAGGLMAAMTAAEAGLRVLLLEAGPFVPPEAMNQREDDMLPRLLWEGGGRTTVDRRTKIHQGRALGGSTVHNINLCKRIPAPLLAEWRRNRGLEHLPPERWEELYTFVEELLEVSDVTPDSVSAHNEVLRRGVEAKGWRGGLLRHNRTGCARSGFCLLGCAYDAKNNAPKMLLPRFVAAGGQVVTRCQAVRVSHRAGRVTGIDAAILDPRTNAPIGRVEIAAPRVCAAGSATGTAALLKRSRVPDPMGGIGETLWCHPALVAAGVMPEPVKAWEGIPQSYECTELLDFEAAHDPSGGPPPLGTRSWILHAFAHPAGLASMVPGQGAEHRALMKQYGHLAVLTTMLHDRATGRVEPWGELGLRVHHAPDALDQAELMTGLQACVELLFAAGATEVVVPTDPLTRFRSPEEAKDLAKRPLLPHALDLTAVHPMGSVPMGDDAKVAAVDSRGRSNTLEGLWVADGSLFPSSIGIPPQLSIYAMGRHVGGHIARGEP